MKIGHWIAGGLAGSVGLFVYGALVEANRLVVERRRLVLPGWPRRLNGFKIAVLADLHIRDGHSADLAKRAVGLALDEAPDVVALPGDIVGYWKPESPRLVGGALEELLLMEGRVVASPGNREYWNGVPAFLGAILDELNIRLLVNDAWSCAGVTWAGVDSANLGEPDPEGVMRLVARHTKRFRPDGADDPSLKEAVEKLSPSAEPVVVLWHEPDLVAQVPAGAALVISGHTHGGQFRTPWGWPPMRTVNGRKYLEGFFPGAPTPLYVSRGIGTAGPPTRLFCPPEVSVLTLESIA